MDFIILLYLLLLFFAKESICLQVVGIKIPKMKQRGESVTLECEYKLEGGGKLYSVKWYRDNEEFYRFMPRLRPPQLAHTLDGVKVDLERSSDRRVRLKDLTLKSRGNYRCEVSEEAPSFYSDQAEAFMEVYYFPREGPQIRGHERQYFLNENLNVTCTSARGFPAPQLQWRIDGTKVTLEAWLSTYKPKLTSQGLLISSLGLHAPVTPTMHLKCIESVGPHRRERTVIIEANAAHQWKIEFTSLLQVCFIHILSYLLRYKKS